jgi:hypothetical protein
MEDGVKLLSPFWRSTAGKVAVAVLVSTAVAVPATVWAVTSFTDVPTSHPFYKEINAVAEAGIAQGFGDGSYHPGDYIKRQGMAAFLERGVGRVASDDGSVYTNSSESTEVARVALDAGANGAGTSGFVRLSGSAFASTPVSTTATCPCTVKLTLWDGNSAGTDSYIQVPLIPNGTDAIGSATVEAVRTVDGDSTHNYRLMAMGIDSFGTDMVVVTGTLTAMYFPLSADGDDTADYELTCPRDDPWEQNDSSASASTFPFTGSTNGIVCGSDHDWFRDDVGATADIVVTVDNFLHSEGDIDVCLWKAAVQLLCATGIGNSETINFPDAPADTYYIEVKLVFDQGSMPGNTYRLTASK